MGKTTEPLNKRLNKHVYAAREGLGRCYRISWLKSLLRQGLTPNIKILFEASDNWQWWESYFIRWFREIEPKLTNLTDGGDGPAIQSTKIEVPCAMCGKVVEKYKNYIKNQKYAYCSVGCGSRGRGKFKTGEGSGPKRKPRFKRTCACGSDFYVTESALRNRPCLYCSRPCAFKYGKVGKTKKG